MTCSEISFRKVNPTEVWGILEGANLKTEQSVMSVTRPPQWHGEEVRRTLQVLGGETTSLVRPQILDSLTPKGRNWYVDVIPLF